MTTIIDDRSCENVKFSDIEDLAWLFVDGKLYQKVAEAGARDLGKMGIQHLSGDVLVEPVEVEIHILSQEGV